MKRFFIVFIIASILRKLFIIFVLVMFLVGLRSTYNCAKLEHDKVANNSIHIDDNGSTGTGFGSIDEPTQIKNMTIGIDTNGITHNVAKDVCGHWDAPEDFKN